MPTAAAWRGIFLPTSCFGHRAAYGARAAQFLSAELSELIAGGLPPLDILIGHLERKASRRGRDDQFPICSGSPYNMRA